MFLVAEYQSPLKTGMLRAALFTALIACLRPRWTEGIGFFGLISSATPLDRWPSMQRHDHAAELEALAFTVINVSSHSAPQHHGPRSNESGGICVRLQEDFLGSC